LINVFPQEFFVCYSLKLFRIGSFSLGSEQTRELLFEFLSEVVEEVARFIRGFVAVIACFTGSGPLSFPLLPGKLLLSTVFEVLLEHQLLQLLLLLTFHQFIRFGLRFFLLRLI
jgi:hypothetical protein